MSDPSTIRIGTAHDDDDGPLSLRPDEMFAPPTPDETAGASPLEQLERALAEPVEIETKTLRVPARPGVTLRFLPDVDDDKRKAWQKRATKKSRRPGREDEVDEMLFACLVLANTHQAISFNGVDAHSEADEPITFAHPKLWNMVGAQDPADCIRKLFAVDAHVLLASGEVLLAAGFDDDLETADPTTDS